MVRNGDRLQIAVNLVTCCNKGNNFPREFAGRLEQMDSLSIVNAMLCFPQQEKFLLVSNYNGKI